MGQQKVLVFESKRVVQEEEEAGGRCRTRADLDSIMQLSF